jgi:hypothetical protein
MCTFGREAEEGWDPVFLRGERPPAGHATYPVRILCGAYDVRSPFIEGGCATDWIEDLSGPDIALSCPGCGQRCPEQVVGGAREMLSTRSVFVIGCVHRAFTFSRRPREPFFSVEDGPSSF